MLKTEINNVINHIFGLKKGKRVVFSKKMGLVG